MSTCELELIFNFSTPRVITISSPVFSASSSAMLLKVHYLPFINMMIHLPWWSHRTPPIPPFWSCPVKESTFNFIHYLIYIFFSLYARSSLQYYIYEPNRVFEYKFKSQIDKFFIRENAFIPIFSKMATRETKEHIPRNINENTSFFRCILF